ncbi:MAG: hypothetical protein KJI72_01045 [Patescibacteria group bacterium]|nr:hypothetical protein [Patescibacteria group bacterium]
MISKTPQFDRALDEILKDIKPHTRKCAWSGKSPYCLKEFEIIERDIEFYNLLRVPPPTLCPNCRRQRRLTFGHTIKLYKRSCDAPRHDEQVVSFVSPVKDFTVYDFKFYRSAGWDPLKYGQEYEVSEPFFDTYYEKLRSVVPQPTIIRDPYCINSDYTLGGRDLKNGYYVSGGWRSENISYSMSVFNSRDSIDCYSIWKCEQCYESVLTKKCYRCDYAYFSNDCLDCAFIYDCRNCSDCFGCVNLRNKKYCIFNKQLSEEEYRKERKKIYLGDRELLEGYKAKFWNLVKESPVRATRIDKSHNSFGNQIASCKNCDNVFHAEKSENLRFAEITVRNKDSMDYSISGGSELLYETVGVGSEGSRVKFSFASKFIIESEYLINCLHCINCFACVGVENKQYCIFNKQYEEDEYWAIVDDIKTKLLERGEYGEFFPLKFSTFAYNDSMAQIIFPLNKEQIEKFGALWQEEVNIDVKGMETVSVRDIPKDIKDVTDDIVNKALICEKTGYPFRIISSELKFYRRKKLPIPTRYPYQRIVDRFAILNNYRIFPEKCHNCNKEIYSSYKSTDGYKPYCEECYQAEVV